MPVTDLATLAQVKLWVPNAPASADDPMLSVLLTACSTSILGYLQRPTVLSRAYVETFDGYGETRKMLRKWPVTSVSSVLIDGTSVAPSSGFPLTTGGYVLENWDGELPGRRQLLDLRGFYYCRGKQNVQISYQAGYLVSAEPQTVSAGAASIAPLNGPWTEDAGVKYAATGVALTRVTTAPSAAGQYQIDTTTPGKYNFNAADNGAGVLISYSYVPQPLNQACIEMVGEAYRYKGRIGERSHTTPGPQTTAFDLSRMTAAIKMMIDPYAAVAPIF
jgi:hypothetical protein